MDVESVITLDTGVSCLLLEKAVYNQDNYFLSSVLNEQDEPSDEYCVFKEIIEDGEKYVEKVEDPKILEPLLKEFTIQFKEMVDNLPDELS